MCLKRLSFYVTSKMRHAHYEEQDPKRSFFLVEASRRSVWPTSCVLATGLT